MREVLRRRINEMRYPNILQINKLKIFTVDKTISSSGAVAENNTTLSDISLYVPENLEEIY